MLEDERTPNARLTSGRRWRNWKEFPINRNAVSDPARHRRLRCTKERKLWRLTEEASCQTEI